MGFATRRGARFGRLAACFEATCSSGKLLESVVWRLERREKIGNHSFRANDRDNDYNGVEHTAKCRLSEARGSTWYPESRILHRFSPGIELGQPASLFLHDSHDRAKEKDYSTENPQNRALR